MDAPSGAGSGVAANRWPLIFCVLVIAAVGALAATRPAPRGAADGGPVARWPAEMSPANATAALAGLAEVENHPEVAYDRIRDFGPAWADVDHNGCDTRDDILARDLVAKRFRAGTSGCVVVAGTFVDPYTGARMHFSKSRATAVQIDHLVPLHAAWTLGAWRWPSEVRVAFANDRRNLVAVSGTTNLDKSDSLADTWRPPSKRIHCVYAINTVAVHVAYHLGVTGPERRALVRMLRNCP